VPSVCVCPALSLLSCFGGVQTLLLLLLLFPILYPTRGSLALSLFPYFTTRQKARRRAEREREERHPRTHTTYNWPQRRAAAAAASAPTDRERREREGRGMREKNSLFPFPLTHSLNSAESHGLGGSSNGFACAFLDSQREGGREATVMAAAAITDGDGETV